MRYHFLDISNHAQNMFALKGIICLESDVFSTVSIPDEFPYVLVQDEPWGCSFDEDVGMCGFIVDISSTYSYTWAVRVGDDTMSTIPNTDANDDPNGKSNSHLN